MASDIVLVLRSEHRDLLLLADQRGRASRGFHDPETGLRSRLHAHVAAAEAEVYPTLRSSGSPNVSDLLHAVERVAGALDDTAITREELAEVAQDLVAAERSAVLLFLAAQMPIGERRRMGRVFRKRRDAALRVTQGHHHRNVSQTELHELARRAGLSSIDQP